MATHFDILFSISLLHDYFEDGIARNMSLTPSPRCRAALKGGELICRQTGDGIAVMVRTEGEEKTPFIPFDKNSKLSFYLLSHDLRFQNYTNLNRTTDSVFYFTNLEGHTVPEPVEEPVNTNKSSSAPSTSSVTGHLLSVKTTVTSEDEIPLRASAFIYTAAGEPAPDKCFIRDAAGNKVEGEGILKIYPKGKIQVNLRDEEAGMFELVAGKETFRFYKDDAIAGQHVLGVVEIFYGNTGFGTKFNIHFTNRSTRWKYFVIEKYSPSPHAYSIVNANNGVVFTHQGEETLPGGEKAQVIESEKEIPLLEKQSLKLQLLASDAGERAQGPAIGSGSGSESAIRSGDEKGEMRIPQLPYPSNDILKGSPGRYYSEMFVYV